ncbi:unnamed protein product [Boreogadus saida]
MVDSAVTFLRTRKRLKDAAGEGASSGTASLPADKETRAEESRAMLLTAAEDCKAQTNTLSVRPTEKRCKGRLQARDPPRLSISPPFHVGEVSEGPHWGLQSRGVPNRSCEKVLNWWEQGALGSLPGGRQGAKTLALHVIRHGGERRGWHREPLMAASPMISPKRSAIWPSFSLGGSPGAGELGRRTSKEVIQGGDVVNLEVLVVGVLGVRNSGPEDVDGLSEVHRRGEKEVPGEEPLFRQRTAGGAGGGSNQGSRGVFSAEAPETRHPAPGKRDRRRTEALKRAPQLL